MSIWPSSELGEGGGGKPNPTLERLVLQEKLYDEQSPDHFRLSARRA